MSHISVNQKGGSIVFSANNDVGLVLNTDLASFPGVLGANTPGETVVEMAMTHFVASGHWHIFRGTEMIWDTGNQNGGFQADFQTHGLRLEKLDTHLQANIHCELVGGNGYLLVKLHKRSTIT
jgi:hypothetical protein